MTKTKMNRNRNLKQNQHWNQKRKQNKMNHKTYLHSSYERSPCEVIPIVSQKRIEVILVRQFNKKLAVVLNVIPISTWKQNFEWIRDKILYNSKKKHTDWCNLFNICMSPIKVVSFANNNRINRDCASLQWVICNCNNISLLNGELFMRCGYLKNCTVGSVYYTFRLCLVGAVFKFLLHFCFSWVQLCQEFEYISTVHTIARKSCLHLRQQQELLYQFVLPSK